MASPPQNNGRSQLLIGILVTLSLALGGWALKRSVAHGESLGCLRTAQSATTRRLDRIDGKLDRILEKLP